LEEPFVWPIRQVMPSDTPSFAGNTPAAPRGPLAGVRIVVVEDMALWRDLVAAVLGGAGGAQIVGKEATVAAAVATIEATKPDVVLLDLFLDDEDGLEVMRQVRAKSPATKWLLLTANARPLTLRDALRLGVHGVVTKNADQNRDLIGGVRTVVDGGEYFSAAVGGILADLVRSEKALLLSPQEEQVLRRLAAGETIKETAHALGVEAGTVAKYLQRIREKWGLPAGEPVVAVVEAGYRLGFLHRGSAG